jgi:hypothetical protein
MASERIQPAVSALMVGALGVAAPVPVAAARGVPLTRALLRGGGASGRPTP